MNGFTLHDPLFIRKSCAVFITVVWAASLSSAFDGAQAQVPPITPSGLTTQVSGPITVGGTTQFNITGGTRPGGGTNLFHSFGEFGVPTNNIANFLNETPNLATSNILGRVTGGNPSNIFGTVQTSGFGNANLFLMNPAGIVFGPNASLNVGGSVTFTTANYLRLADTGIFHADPEATSVLTSASVASFGFLGSNLGAITVQGSQFSVTDGQSISLVGGNVTIQSGTVESGAAQPTRLSAPNGKIQLASAASPGEFDATTLQPLPNVNGASFSAFGAVSLEPSSRITVSGANTVSVRSGQFVLSVNDAVLTTTETAGAADSIDLSRGSSIVTSNSGTDPGADIQLAASQLVMDGAMVRSNTVGEGSGGNISVSAQSIALGGGAQIASAADGSGSSGAVNVDATNSLTISGFDTTSTLTGIASDLPVIASGVFTNTTAEGAGGTIAVSALRLIVEDTGRIATFTSGDGAGGNISVHADAIDLRTGGRILTGSGLDFVTFETRGNGNAGAIDLNTHSLSITGVDSFGANSAIRSTPESTGDGGSITVAARSITLDEQGIIETIPFGDGLAGNITLTANTMAITGGGGIQTSGSDVGPSGDIRIMATDTVSIRGTGADGTPSRITNENYGNGGTGNIAIQAKDLIVADGAWIRSTTFYNPVPSSEPKLSLHASELISLSGGADVRVSGFLSDIGSIEMSAPTIAMTDRATVSTFTFENGHAGNISIASNSLELSGGSQITSSTWAGTGRGGDIIVTVTDELTLSGQFTGATGAVTPTAIISNSQFGSSGNAGQVTINAGRLGVANGARIESNSTDFSTGDAGTVAIFSPSVLVETGGAISTLTDGAGNAGTIRVNTNNFRVNSGGRITSSSVLNSSGDTPTGTSGSVIISGIQSPAQSVVIAGPGSGLFTETQGTGNGGNITTWANEVRLTDQATLSSKTTGPGDAGNILVKADIFRMESEATITAASTGPGNAGTVTIQGINSLANSVLIEGAGTGLFTNTEDQGRGGDVSIETAALTIQDGGMISATTTGIDALATGGNINITASQAVDLRSNASISASSTGPADAGNISINAGNRFEARNSLVTTRSEHAGGGNIAINALDQIRLVNSQVNASAFLNGGNVSIDPNLVILQNSSILAQAIQGNGGNITIFTPLFLADSSSLVSASSQFGLSGTVTIQSPTSNLSGSLGTLSSKPRQAQSLLTQRCAALANGQASSFVVAGREQLPADPGGWLTSPLAFASLDESFVAGDAVGSLPTITAMPTHDDGTVSLRRFTPTGFLMANYADSEATGCHS